MKRIAAIITTILLLNSAFAQKALNDFTGNRVLENANISLLVKDLSTGKTLYQLRPQTSIVPASTIKLVTTATALELYGPDYRFETTLEIDGEITDSVLNGNLYIVGSGDPTLGSEKMGDANFMDKWINAIKQAGIRHINGSVIADATRFDEEGVNPKWTWDDIGNYYSPGIWGIAYLDNTVRVTFKSDRIGTTPEIIRVAPEIPEMTIENRLKSTAVKFDSAYFYGAPKSFQRTVSGAIPAFRPAFTVRAEIPNPALLLAQHFTQRLQQNGISVRENPSENPLNKQKTTIIHKHYSPALSEIITEVNVKSNNFYAEQLFRSLGLRNNNVATTDGAIRVIRSFWQSKRLPIEQLFMNDGSGLTPTNGVSAHFFVELLTYMQTKSAHSEAFYNSLAIAGEKGTLEGILKNTELQGKIYAKSGTIARVRCYCGYIDYKDKKYVFAIMVNNANGNSWAVTKRIEDFLLAIVK